MVGNLDFPTVLYDDGKFLSPGGKRTSLEKWWRILKDPKAYIVRSELVNGTRVETTQFSLEQSDGHNYICEVYAKGQLPSWTFHATRAGAVLAHEEAVRRARA